MRSPIDAFILHATSRGSAPHATGKNPDIRSFFGRRQVHNDRSPSIPVDPSSQLSCLVDNAVLAGVQAAFLPSHPA
jgi:hypothetical protein